MPVKLKFPRGFLWGTSASSYQVEGNIRNNWSEWESSAERIRQLKQERKNPEDFINKQACNHYNLYEKDFDLAKKLHTNAHRFSVEWARIEPEEGKFSQKEIGHYRKIINALRKRKIEPFLTAHHFTLPLWLSEEGGWLNSKSVTYFERYISRLADEFGDIKFWITINEPVVLAYKGYWRGEWPPCLKSLGDSFKVIHNLISAHKSAYKIIHELAGKKVGIAKSMIYFMGLLRFSDYVYNKYFLDKIRGYQDFIGLNYYTRKKIPREKSIERSDMGWAISPRGMYKMLRSLGRYRLPIYITENGIADSKDRRRTRYIVQHLKQVHNAISEGIDIRGYFYWSIIDNFEWDQGFTKKFGLVEIDYNNMERKPRGSFYDYGKICKGNSISRELQKKFL